MSIESRAASDDYGMSDRASSDVSYGAWVKCEGSIHTVGSVVIGNTTYSQQETVTKSSTASGTLKVYGMTVGHVYQMYASFDNTLKWSDTKNEYNRIQGKDFKQSTGTVKFNISNTSPFLFNGSNNPVISISYPMTYTGTSVNTGDSSFVFYQLNSAWQQTATAKFTYWYREVFNWSEGQKLDSINGSINESTTVQKNIFSSITDFFGSFFQNIINAFVSLFVPSSEEMSGLFDQLNQFFSDRFGFLYAPFDYMIRLCKVFTSSTGSTSLTFPGFSIMGEQVWADQVYDLASDELVGTILGYVRTGTGILLAGYFIMFLQNFFKERFGTG